MVMKKNAMGKNVRRTIRKSLGRYIAIVAIIALGAGMFVGLLGTKTDMVATAQRFTDDTNMFHLRLLSTYGWRAEDVEQVARMEGVAEAEGSISMDAVGVFSINALGVQTEEKEEAVYRLHSIPERISQVHLLGGRMPEAPDECLVDGSHADDSVLGTTFQISSNNEEDLLESVSVTTFTVVGYVSTPLYMDMSRGSTTLGNGDLANYIYIPPEAFCVDYYTEIGVIIQGDFEVYTDGSTRAMEDMAKRLEPGVTLLAQDRFQEMKGEALAEYEDGLKEYEDGLKEYEDGRQEALAELEKALKELQDGQIELDEGLVELEDAEKQLLDAQGQLEYRTQELEQARQDLEGSKEEAYAQFADAEAELAAKEQEAVAGLEQVRGGYPQIDDGIAQLEAGIDEVDAGIGQIDQMIASQQQVLSGAQAKLETEEDPEAIAQLQQDIAVAQGTIAECEAQKQQLSQKKGELSAQLDALRAQRLELERTEKTLLEAQESIRQGYVELEASKAQAEAQFQQAEDEIMEGEAALAEAEAELSEKWSDWEDGKEELAQAQKDLEQGWIDYEKAKLDVEAELSEAEAELADAKVELDDALAQIEGLEEPEVFLLDRNTNVGYLAVDNNSDIVAGVSRVFPAFFLLVAALVCITTMTRMVDEERTQIGILKALGYSNGKIIGKYLTYTGSASLLGCTLGVLIGSVAFPKILWYAYSIILNLTPDIVLVLDWPLCLSVVGAYTAVSMLVTWYCCRKELKEVPAELIRPKSPAAGKKILLEYLPFWDKISFLNKVMFRNVFRYKQRLLMMLVGIGGCTALLLTGFGVGDSIQGIVDYQFQEVTVYDMEVFFSEGLSPEAQETFRKEMDAGSAQFFHQRSVDLQFGDKTREVYLIASDDKIGEFIDLHCGDDELTMPGVGETYLSAGVAEAFGVKTGDTITVRDADMQTMDLTVAGIFDNHVYNYVIIRPETMVESWGQEPEYQMAYVYAREGQDVYQLGAHISSMDQVMNVTICQEVADQVGSMLEAMDLIVLTIVVCAGALAVIVLYNLTNISITERIREIATIKVLGFNASETAAYVFKENLSLTVAGSGFGLLLGYLLLLFVMSQIKIDMVWFKALIEPVSYVWSIVLTLLSAVVVDFIFYFKLEKINMAEALKSVE